MNTAIPLKLFFIGTLLVFVLRRKSSSNLGPSLLTTNMHLPIGLFCILIPNSYTRSLNKRLHQTLSVDDDRLCRLRASFMMGAVSGIFCSTKLQAPFRLWHILFYTRPRLQQFHFYVTMIVRCLWMVPNLLLHDFEMAVFSANIDSSIPID